MMSHIEKHTNPLGTLTMVLASHELDYMHGWVYWPWCCSCYSKHVNMLCLSALTVHSTAQETAPPLLMHFYGAKYDH